MTGGTFHKIQFLDIGQIENKDNLNMITGAPPRKLK